MIMHIEFQFNQVSNKFNFFIFSLYRAQKHCSVVSLILDVQVGGFFSICTIINISYQVWFPSIQWFRRILKSDCKKRKTYYLFYSIIMFSSKTVITADIQTDVNLHSCMPFHTEYTVL